MIHNLVMFYLVVNGESEWLLIMNGFCGYFHGEWAYFLVVSNSSYNHMVIDGNG